MLKRLFIVRYVFATWSSLPRLRCNEVLLHATTTVTELIGLCFSTLNSFERVGYGWWTLIVDSFASIPSSRPPVD